MKTSKGLKIVTQGASIFCNILLLLSSSLGVKYINQILEVMKIELAEGFIYTASIACNVSLLMVERLSRTRLLLLMCLISVGFIPMPKRWKYYVYGSICVMESISIVMAMISCVQLRRNSRHKVKHISPEVKSRMRSLGQKLADGNLRTTTENTMATQTTMNLPLVGEEMVSKLQSLSDEEHEEKEPPIYKPLQAMKLTEASESYKKVSKGPRSWLADADMIRKSLNVNEHVTFERTTGSILRPATLVLPSENKSIAVSNSVSKSENLEITSTDGLATKSKKTESQTYTYSSKKVNKEGKTHACSRLIVILIVLLIGSMSFNVYFVVKWYKWKISK